jgi:hypothetical protein
MCIVSDFYLYFNSRGTLFMMGLKVEIDRSDPLYFLSWGTIFSRPHL